MKYLTFILLVLLYACSSTTAQSPSPDVEADKEFQKLLNKVAETQQATAETQQAAEEKQAKIVDKTVSKIVDLKKLIEADNIQYETIHKINKEKNKNLKISNNEKEENDNKKLINKELKQNRLEKNILKDNIQKNIDEIDLLKKELKNLYSHKILFCTTK